VRGFNKNTNIKTKNKMYTIEEKYVKELELFLQEMPLKFGLPILNLLNAQLKKQEESLKEEPKNAKK
jgi:hypothetical protein